MDGFPAPVPLVDAAWPETSGNPRPGDLQFFVPQGFGMGAPAIVRPYGGPPEESFYGFHAANAHPFLNAPLTEFAGGTLYFDDNATPELVIAALELMGVYRTLDYVAFGKSSADPVNERYLDQMRFVSDMALQPVFGATSATPPPKQTLDIPAAIAAFIAAQKEKWRDTYTFSAKLAGLAGGDGDWAKESLSFGFHVENTYWGIYRLWSRAWLVTK